MKLKIKQFLKKLWYGPDPPQITLYKDIELEEHKLLKPNDEEYHFPELFKTPKVKFRIKPAKK